MAASETTCHMTKGISLCQARQASVSPTENVCMIASLQLSTRLGFPPLPETEIRGLAIKEQAEEIVKLLFPHEHGGLNS